VNWRWVEEGDGYVGRLQPPGQPLGVGPPSGLQCLVPYPYRAGLRAFGFTHLRLLLCRAVWLLICKPALVSQWTGGGGCCGQGLGGQVDSAGLAAGQCHAARGGRAALLVCDRKTLSTYAGTISGPLRTRLLPQPTASSLVVASCFFQARWCLNGVLAHIVFYHYYPEPEAAGAHRVLSWSNL
jgi:hypothetical protein